MEKNFFLAVILSALVLFTYQTIFVQQKSSQVTENNKKDISINIIKEEKVEEASYNKTTSGLIKPNNLSIQYKNNTFYYTNVGGLLHKVVFNDKEAFPVTNILGLLNFQDFNYLFQQINKNEIVFTYKSKDIEIKKLFTKLDSNVTKVRMEIKNKSEISSLENSIIGLEIDASYLKQENSREFALFEYSVSLENKILRKGNAYKFNEKEYKKNVGKVYWIGFRNHYNAIILKPEFYTKNYEIKPLTDKNIMIILNPINKINPGESAVYNFSIYSGPQNKLLMKKYGLGFEKIIAFSSFYIIEWISQGIYYTIPFLHSIFKSWGFSIILISILIYFLTYPLTMKSMLSMRKMQEVQPKIVAIRQKYKNDPKKLNMEMIEIYRREKINPFGGCLPFLIQMPFFMALYQILWRAQYFQGTRFLWIKDLSQPDRLIILPFNLPFFGNEINILPILTGIMMFVQQKISSKNMAIVDEQQAMQQKMMMYILPVMISVMFYKFSSSWAVYFLVFYILSTITQYKIAKIK